MIITTSCSAQVRSDERAWKNERFWVGLKEVFKLGCQILICPRQAIRTKRMMMIFSGVWCFVEIFISILCNTNNEKVRSFRLVYDHSCTDQKSLRPPKIDRSVFPSNGFHREHPSFVSGTCSPNFQFGNFWMNSVALFVRAQMSTCSKGVHLHTCLSKFAQPYIPEHFSSVEQWP